MVGCLRHRFLFTSFHLFIRNWSFLINHPAPFIRSNATFTSPLDSYFLFSYTFPLFLFGVLQTFALFLTLSFSIWFYSSFNVCSHPPTPLPDPRFAASYRLGVMNRVNGFIFYFSIVAINIRVRIWGGMKQNTGFHQQKVPRPPSSVPRGDREKGGWGGMVQKRCTSTIVICELISTC